ncbi:CinA family nicotinamide mononucleotide deamidase-related protein [Puniceicoccales bacterium CK1056]|uniref:CinA-like protein n=1 Tax=Oceanipulchritudo coccoides TaxID=2706888 RepID=A0A6B2M1U4_9BACT|nr:CinA family nicotinamide mononucleotide deamidase-related protein [Oceanipulchritudo coccoides]NDV62047.1 CinA family nicotinamide mononucleotide deamidase-related protein [Oceanipulchritudo coccoides]
MAQQTPDDKPTGLAYRAMKTLHRVELVAIGDELLNGLRANSHLVYLGDLLQKHDLGITRASEIRDEPEEMLAAFQQALERSDLIIVTGGLGPTSDDRTADCMASALKTPLVTNKAAEEAIVEFFRARDREPTPNNFKQCEIVEGGEALLNSNGTAPGQWIEKDEKVIVLLPGPPRELKPMFEEQVLPRLLKKAWAKEGAPPVEIRTLGLGESVVADMLEPILAEAGDKVRVAYCAHMNYVDVRLTPVEGGLDGKALRALGEVCRQRLGIGFLGYGTPDIACVILKQLRGLNKSLAVAESCTGGLLASRFTDMAGASKVFKGGVVCYNNEIKEAILNIPDCILSQHGAVSAECAVAMATAVAELMESDYALAITGYAGPNGGREPAGTVYLGYHSPVGAWSRKVVLPGNRIAVKERAVVASLDFLRHKLEKYKMYDLLESLKC